MLEVCSVDGELVIGVELGFVGEVGAPRVGPLAFEDVHTMVDGRAVVGTVHVYLGRGRVVVRVRGEYHIPDSIELMELRGPEIGRVV